MPQNHAVDGEPVEVAHDPVHFIEDTSKVLAAGRRLDAFEFFNAPYPVMVQGRRVDNGWPLDHRYAANDVSQLDYLLDSTMNVARVRFSVDDDISVELHDQPHMTRA